MSPSSMLLLVMLMLFSTTASFSFDPTPMNYAPVNITDDWQICYAFAASEYSPTFSDIRALCGNGPLAFGQTNAINPNVYSAVYRGFRNVTIDLAVNTIGSSGGYTTFFTSTSFGIGNASVSDCTTAGAGTVLCWNVNTTGGEYQFAPGGFTNANDGYQTQPTIYRVIYSAPCYFSTVGDTCYLPSYGLCQPGKCLGNVTCDNTTVVTPPTLANGTCQLVGECNPYTGNYSIVNATDGSSCFGGDYCVSNYQCLFGACIMTNNTAISAVCPQPTNQCSQAPICTSGNTSAICTYPPNTGAICQADSAYLCRTNDVCDANSVCVPGVLRTSLLSLTDCITSYTCDNSTGNITSTAAPFNTPCNTTNPCLLPGGCNGTVCYSNTPKPIPNDTFCYPGSCNPQTGAITYNYANTGLVCTPDGPPLLCQVYVCMTGNCTYASQATCPNTACYTASCTDDNVGCVQTPQNGTACTTGSFCTGQGICLQSGMTSTCVLTGAVDCNDYVPPDYDPNCGFYYCDSSLNTCVANTTGLVGTPCSSNPCVPLSSSKCNDLAQCTGAIAGGPQCMLSKAERTLNAAAWFI